MNKLIRQVRQRVSIASLDVSGWIDDGFPDFPSVESQQKILSVIVKIAHTNGYYAQRVVKLILERLEASQEKDSVILDGLYEELCELMSEKPMDPTETDILEYTIEADNEETDKDKVIRIRESPRLLLGMGTTGLRTWDASLFLSQYLVEVLRSKTPELAGVRMNFVNRSVIELGCGTGFVGICLYKLFRDQLKQMIFTDGDTRLIDRISTNFALNDMSIDAKDLKVCKLWWGEDDFPNTEINTIVAADVTYDGSVIPDLVETLNEAMSQDNGKYGRVDTAYIAATVRNSSTMAIWTEYLEMGKKDQIWEWEVIESSRNPNKVTTDLSAGDNSWKSVWYPIGVSEIRIYKLSRM
ncbi:hypothetical protein FOA43_004462 [Brettanomyces nanus]|uniref:Methyltransferase n=1 Tax=Eeniella nana TaxID=13502 RepID=A0A875SEI9_EENNA|nr:uncharacterized protein FOA43_004462 [Brettanomyces nanus]QPG77064.1 hypothetical protein FOA43_004462 [Brettanomyces nanus]